MTLDGQPFPANQYETADIFAVNELGEVDLGRTHLGLGSTVLVAGSYDLVYRRVLGGAIVPRNSNAVIGSFAGGGGARGPVPVAADLDSAEIEGDFLVNGEPASASQYEVGSIEIRRAGPQGTDDIIDLGDTDDQSYAVRLLTGSYDVLYRHTLGGADVPRNTERKIATDVLFDSADVDIDIAATPVSGSIRLNGSPAPASDYEWGRIHAIDPESGSATLLGETRDGNYFALLIPGEYTVAYEHVLGGAQVPINEWAVFGNLSVPSVSSAASVARNTRGAVLRSVDIPAVDATFQIQLDGVPWFPLFGSLQAELLHADGTHSHDLPTTSSGQWAGKFVATGYRMRYIDGTGPAAPVNLDTLLPGLYTPNVAQPTVTWNLETTNLEVQLTVDGETPELGNLAALNASNPNAFANLGIDTSGWPGPHRLLNGSYNLIYSHLSGDLPINIQQKIADVHLGCILCDGFEQGHTQAWSDTVP